MSPKTSQRSRSKHSGYTIVELIITFAIVAILSAILIPNLLHNLYKQKSDNCISNLRALQAAKENWIADHPGMDLNSQPANALLPYVNLGQNTSTPTLPTCPDGGVYTNLTNPTAPVSCSIHGTPNAPTQ